jgi:hypothetical protein
MIDFPFIYKHFFTIASKKSVAFVLEWIKGMELFDVIREIGKNLKL